MRHIGPIAILLAGLASTAVAAPVVYTFEGDADFSFGPFDFDDEGFSVVATGDTDDIVNQSGNVSSIPVSAIFTTDAFNGDFQADLQVVFLADARRIGLAEDDFDARVTGRSDLLQNYSLNQSIGPIALADFEVEGSFNIGDFRLEDGGVLDATFEAQVVPLPATAPLLLAGLGALAVWRRRCHVKGRP